MNKSSSNTEGINQVEDVENIGRIQRSPELDLRFIFQDTDYSWSKCKSILELVHFGGYNRFSEMLEVISYSKATISKYLNGLKDNEILEKQVNDDRTVEWVLTEKGELTVLYHNYLYVPVQSDNPVDYIKRKKEEIRRYALDKGFDEEMTSLDLEAIEEKFGYFQESYGADVLKNFLKTFLDVEADNYTHAVTRKEN
jgi:DNA-binding MarR family transcriptional regulator